jgi:hypothetical protein
MSSSSDYEYDDDDDDDENYDVTDRMEGDGNPEHCAVAITMGAPRHRRSRWRLACKLHPVSLEAKFDVDVVNLSGHCRACLYTFDDFRVGRVSSPGVVVPFLPLRQSCVRTFVFKLSAEPAAAVYLWQMPRLEVTFRVLGVYTSPHEQLLATTPQDSLLFRNPDFVQLHTVSVTAPWRVSPDRMLTHHVY